MSNENQTFGTSYKTIRQFIQELQTFENKELIVMVSDDGGETLKPVKLVGKEFADDKPYCTIFF